MIAVVSDTHRSEGHGLEGRTLDAVRGADAVLHAGDFTTGAVLEAFRAEAADLYAVRGNNDGPDLRDRLPAERIVGVGGLRVAMAHGHTRSEDALRLFGLESDADAVVFGHSHRPAVIDAGDVTLLNPGSHAEPRRYRPAHAEIEGGRGRLVDPEGSVIETFAIG